ncbi:MAG: VTT domain-containing protein [Pseudonocardiales bacterium]|nr:VTT domain-containing protein [Pseudonocardiales bacterium]
MLVPGTCLLLVVLVTLDGPFPVVPSEPLLMTAVGVFSGDPPAVAALLGSALTGSVLGDALLFGAGRGSRRVRSETRLTRWVAANVAVRPGATLVGARFLPGGRLVSTVAAGRYGVPPRRFAAWSLLSSAAWVSWMLALGLALGPLVAGDPWRGLLAGCTTAVLIAAVTRAVAAVRDRRNGTGPPSVATGPLIGDR